MQDAPPIRVAIVEDNPEICEQLVRIISAAPNMLISGTWADGKQAVAQLPSSGTEVALMDIGLPEMDGIECVRALCKLAPQIRFMMLTVIDDTEKIFESLKAGATGYLVKSDGERLLKSICELHAGASPMSSSIARKIIRYFSNASPEAARFATLTLREEEILRKLAEGMIYKEAADALNISDKTVRSHCNHIYKKLQVCSKSEAVRLFHKHGRTN